MKPKSGLMEKKANMDLGVWIKDLWNLESSLVYGCMEILKPVFGLLTYLFN